jgi:hypothetical protein
MDNKACVLVCIRRHEDGMQDKDEQRKSWEMRMSTPLNPQAANCKMGLGGNWERRAIMRVGSVKWVAWGLRGVLLRISHAFFCSSLPCHAVLMHPNTHNARMPSCPSVSLPTTGIVFGQNYRIKHVSLSTTGSMSGPLTPGASCVAPSLIALVCALCCTYVNGAPQS